MSTEPQSNLLIDTSLIIDDIRQRGRSAALKRSLAIYGVGAISIVTQIEYETGEIWAGRQPDFLRDFPGIVVIPLTDPTLRRVPYIQARSIALNREMGFADLLIATTAIYHNLRLLTLNVDHFNHLRERNY
jgi:predicted nucleic acid-binding protein